MSETTNLLRPKKTAGYGWTPDVPDFRDRKLKAPAYIAYPTEFSLLDKMPPVYDQQQISSCTAHAIAGAIEYLFLLKNIPFMPSRQFIYYNERFLENSVDQDCGAMLRDGMKVVNKIGVCPESLWQYSEQNIFIKPAAVAYQQALRTTVTNYAAVEQNLPSIKHCLAVEHLPFVLGISVYESFEDAQVARTGVVNMPQTTESLMGGHAILAVGYNDKNKTILCRNSWGVNWGQNGYFTLPYDYVLNPNLAGDFWTALNVISSYYVAAYIHR